MLDTLALSKIQSNTTRPQRGKKWQMPDRMPRFMAGAVLQAAVGIVMPGTAAFRFCPAYTVLGIRPCPIRKT
jgi:hypothetical protein